jgi:CRP-like cAMP-binding protein
MSEKIRKLKENASRLIAKGKMAEAAEEYVKIVKADPRDLTARQKLAEIYARMGKIPMAVVEYQSVAGSYAADGLLLKAIAVCKIILQIDPSHTETQQILADLSTRRRGESGAVEMPKAMSAAITGGKRSASEIRGVPSSQLKPKPRPGTPEAQALDVALSTSTPPPQVPGMAAAGPGNPVVIHEVKPKLPERRTDGGEALGNQVGTSPADLALATARAAALAALGGAPASTSTPPPPPDEDDGIDVSFDSGEGAPIVLTSLVEGEPEPSAPIIVGASLSGEGAPVVMGASLSQEGDAFPPLPPDVQELPPDEENAYQLEGVSEDDSDVIELTEPARIELDKVPPIPLFSDLPRDAFIALTERMDLRVASKDDILVQEGEPGQSMFIIIQGSVVVKRRELDGSGDIVLAELGDGAFFGEMALLSDAPRMASVVCADDTMLFEISRELLNDITKEYPSVGEVMKKFHKNRLITNLLKTSPIFQPFSMKDKKDLIEKFKSRSVDEGTFLITREHPGEGLYVVLSGRCEVYDQNSEGRDVLLAELKGGDVFGEMSMLWHKKTCASVKAVTPCVVLRLPKSSFNEVIMTHPQILETLTALSERRQKQNEELKAPAVATDFIV